MTLARETIQCVVLRPTPAIFLKFKKRAKKPEEEALVMSHLDVRANPGHQLVRILFALIRKQRSA
jgi:hypothetical protein